MDKRINAAAAALPKLEPLIQVFFKQHAPAVLSCSDEELFYDVSNRDIYVALTFSVKLDDNSVSQKELIVRVPINEDPEIIDTATVLEKDLEDITHIIPTAVFQVLKNQYIMIQLQTALQTSALLIDTCELPPELKAGQLGEISRRYR